MDPYLKVKLGTFCMQTKVAKDQGKNPTWQDVKFIFLILIYSALPSLKNTKKNLLLSVGTKTLHLVMIW